MSKLKDNKLFAIFVAVSSVIIIAGIILYALLGFNTMADKLDGYRIDVNYNVIIGLNDKEEARTPSRRTASPIPKRIRFPPWTARR